MTAAQRTKAAWGDALVGLAILALAAVCALLFWRTPDTGALRAEIRLDGQVVGEYDLAQLDQPLRLEIQGEYPLVLELSRDGVRVAETTCPGGDCMHMGTISAAGRQIICLPNRLVVTLVGADSNFDVMIG